MLFKKIALLNGSVAVGTASESSDWDMIVFGQREDFVSQVINGITVEMHYTSFNSAIKKLKSNPMEVYKYLDSKIEYDNGRIHEIITYAENIIENYCVSEKDRHEITYWLKCTKLKLEAAFEKNDILLISYLASTNTWKVLKGIWAVNQKPLPPSSSLYRRYRELDHFPCANWFEGLFIDDAKNRGKNMNECIEWILERLAQ